VPVVVNRQPLWRTSTFSPFAGRAAPAPISEARRPIVDAAPAKSGKSFCRAWEKIGRALWLGHGNRPQGVWLICAGAADNDRRSQPAFARRVVLKTRSRFLRKSPPRFLAQVDFPPLGGKNRRSTRPKGQGNLIGLFHQPRIVIADTALLKTLAATRALCAGYAEVV